jgi:exopolysaccharide biosynthesis predicted pyruvyltransferase EpsI
LHFAIVGLAYGRDVYIAPGAYHKNRSMYDTWLSELGCKWIEDARQIEALAAQ